MTRTLGDEDLIAAAETVVKSLKSQANELVAIKGRNLATEISTLFRAYIVQELSPQFADARTRQWAISYALYRLPKSEPIASTPQRSVIVGKPALFGDYYIAQGFNEAAEYLAAEIARVVCLDGFSAPALRAALQNLRGPISHGGGYATMRRSVIKPGNPERIGSKDHEYNLVVDVMRLNFAENHFPKKARKPLYQTKSS